MLNQEIYDLIDRFERSSLHSLKIRNENQYIEMTKENTAKPEAAPACIQEAAPVRTEPQNHSAVITSPLVGTFYTAPAPDQPPFVSVGDHVKKGQTVCLIEAMKMMSEIPAPCDGIIEEVVKNDGDFTAFEEPLFRYRVV